MALYNQASSEQPNGQIEIKEVAPGLYHVFFTPPTEAIPQRVADSGTYKRRIIIIDLVNKLFTFHPYLVWSAQPMRYKYHKLHSVSFDIKEDEEKYFIETQDIEGFLAHILPYAFVEDYNYGLGFRKNYKFIATMLESFNIEWLHISNKETTSIDLDLKKAVIRRSDFSILTSNIDYIAQRTQRVSASLKKEDTIELFSQMVKKGTPIRNRKQANEELDKRMGRSTRLSRGGATQKEQKDAIEVIRKNGEKIIREQPSELVKLRNEIELVTLENLVKKFEDMLDKQLSESHWQKLFDANPFILNLAFGIPVLKVQGQASVGGLKLSGSGTKITDYLVKNRVTNNAAIIEIKTPSTTLIGAKYREGIFKPSSELTGAINQILDQIYVFQKEINSIRSANRNVTPETYYVQGILIVGMSLNNIDEQKSFELYRGNSKNIQVITFDELLIKLKDLHSFLVPENCPSPTSNEEYIFSTDESELPF